MESPDVAELRAELRAERARFDIERAGFERERAHFGSVFEGIGEGIVITDLENRVLSVNERMGQISGYAREEMVGRIAYQVLLPRDEWDRFEWRRERRLVGQSDDYQIQIQRKDGARRWLEVHVTPLCDASGAVVGSIGAQTDITERRRSEEALAQSEARLRGVIEGAVDGLVVHDFDGFLLEVNGAFCELVGMGREELLGVNVCDIGLGPKTEAFVGELLTTLQTQRAIVPATFRRADGTNVPLEVTFGQIDWNGSPAILAIVRDVSDRDSREAAQRELQARLKSLGAASDGLVLADPEGQIVMWSEGAHRMFGWSESEALAMGVVDLIPERFREAHREGMARLAAEDEPRPVERPMSLVGLHREGWEFTLESTLGVWREGPHTFYVEVMRDVSERQAMERELRGALWERKLLMEAVPDALFRLDTQGRLVAWNKRLEEVTGYPPEYLEGRLALEFFAPADHERVAEAIQQTFEHGVLQIEAPIFHADGAATPYSFSALALRDADGQTFGLAGTGRDVSEQRRIEAEIRASLKEKEVLLKEIHHRVKNNLQIINSLLSMQTEAIDDPRVRAALDESRNRIRAMALIHETLYTEGDLGHIEVASYLNRLVNALVRGYRESGRHVEARLDVPTGLSLPLDTAVPCGLIINELVTNSFKYAFPRGSDGHIFVSVECEDERAWTLRVGDDGVGMPDLDLNNLSSTGLQLVTGLCDQLEASYRVEHDGGTRWTISFITT